MITLSPRGSSSMRPLQLTALFLATQAFADEPPPGEKLFPLATGNTWTYKVSGQDERFFVKAVRQEMIGEQTCMLLEASLKDKVVATEHVAFLKNGLHRFREDKDDLTPPICVLRTPLPASGRWGLAKKGDFHIGTRAANASFNARSEEITVFGTKYKTTYVRADMTEAGRWLATSESWYAEGVGVVKQQIREFRDGTRPPLVLELEKFEKGDGK